MRQHEIPKRLCVAQTGTVADHQPRMGPQHGDVIGRGFRVGRADADVNQRDPGPVRALEVVGRHLRSLDRRRQRRVAVRNLDIAGRDEGRVAAIGVTQHSAGVFLELGDVELVVGEQHVALEMFGIGCGVMRQPCQRIIDALRGEGGQRAHVVQRQIGAVDNVVIGCAQVRHVKHIAQGEIRGTFLRDRHAVVIADREMHGDWRVGYRDGHGLAVVFDQQTDLLCQVMFEQFRPRDRGREGAGGRHMAERQP